ncbi:MAG: kynureninase [Inquilinus sp.]|nr:kynureninase [Inquilinus sp.]
MSELPMTRADCEALDTADPLRSFRDRFDLPDGVIYLDGNSLGALPKATAPRLAEMVGGEWGGELIRGWLSRGWMAAPRAVGAKIARLVGAEADEVLVADTTAINLFKLLAAAIELNPGRTTVLSDTGNFPTDLYMVQGLGTLLGDRCRLRVVEPEAVEAAIDDDTAIVMLTEIDYRTGRRHDMARGTRAAHAKGALTIWDLAHSAGAIPVDLNRPLDLDGGRLDGPGADFAVGCGYKYLNGGPGAPAFLYVARRWQDKVRPALSGWLGHAEPFAFDLDYRPAPGIDRMICSTPSVLAVAALDCGVELMAEADAAARHAKSRALGDLFVGLVERDCAAHGFTLASPRNSTQRGSQVSFAHPQGYSIMQALIARGVIGDFRAPDLIRFGFAPLYNGHADVWDAVATLRAVMETAAWDRPEWRTRAAVT